MNTPEWSLVVSTSSSILGSWAFIVALLNLKRSSTHQIKLRQSSASLLKNNEGVTRVLKYDGLCQGLPILAPNVVLTIYSKKFPGGFSMQLPFVHLTKKSGIKLPNELQRGQMFSIQSTCNDWSLKKFGYTGDDIQFINDLAEAANTAELNFLSDEHIVYTIRLRSRIDWFRRKWNQWILAIWMKYIKDFSKFPLCRKPRTDEVKYFLRSVSKTMLAEEHAKD